MVKGPHERHLAAIKSGEITKTNVIGIRKALNAADRERRGYSVSRTAPKMSILDAASLGDAVQHYMPRVTGELVESGKRLLRSPRYAKRWGEHERRIIEKLEGFRLIRFDDIGNGCCHAVPVYLAEDANGCSFAFRNIPWQSGGDGPEIVSKN